MSIPKSRFIELYNSIPEYQLQIDHLFWIMTASWTSYETATSPFCYLTNLLNNDQIWYDIWTNVAWRKEEIQRIYDLFKQYSQEPTITMSGITKYNTHNQPHHLTITSTQVDQCLAHFLKTPSALDDRNINSLTISFFNTHTINCLQFLRLCVICSDKKTEREKNPCHWIRLAIIFRRYDSHMKNFLDYTDITRMCRDLNTKRSKKYKPLLAYNVFHLFTVLGEDKINFQNFLKGVRMEFLPNICDLLQADFFTLNHCYAILSIETPLTNSFNQLTFKQFQTVSPYVFYNIQVIDEQEKKNLATWKERKCPTLEKTKGTFTISSKEIPTKSNTMACDVSSNNEFQAYSNIKLCVTQNRTNGQSVPTSLKSASTNVLLHQKNILLTTCCKTFKKQDTNCMFHSTQKNNVSNNSVLFDFQQASYETECTMEDILIYCSLTKWNVLCLAWEIRKTARSLDHCNVTRIPIARNAVLTLDQKKIATKLYFLLIENLQSQTNENVRYSTNVLHSCFKTSQGFHSSNLYPCMKSLSTWHQNIKHELMLIIQISSQVFYETAQWISEYICDYHFNESFRYISGTLTRLTCHLFLTLWCIFLIKVTLNLMIPFNYVESSVLESLYDVQRHIIMYPKKSSQNVLLPTSLTLHYNKPSNTSVDSIPFRSVKLLEYLEITPFDLALQISIAHTLT